MSTLRFNPANSKLQKLYKIKSMQEKWGLGDLPSSRHAYSFDLPAGRTCPGANICKSQVVLVDGKRKVKDGAKCQFRCYAASDEARYEGTYNVRKGNEVSVKKALKSGGVKKLVEEILKYIPYDAGVIRLHTSGDFFSQSYLMAWRLVAKQRPDILFYAYTKSLRYLVGVDMEDGSQGVLLPNFLVTASEGGKYDSLIKELGVRSVDVVFDEKDTDRELDENDGHASSVGGSFSLLLHGTQPPKSAASAAWQKIKMSKKS